MVVDLRLAASLATISEVDDGVVNHPLRLFADNFQWWVLNVGKEPLFAITVTFESPAGPVAVDGLAIAELPGGTQRCAPVPALNDIESSYAVLHATYRRADGVVAEVDRTLRVEATRLR